ncbi:MAG: DUF6090 family protein [Bacteroidota bacterium]
MKKINWVNHGVELVVVIIGISIAFSLNNWRDSRTARKHEKEYLSSMLEDLAEDMGRLVVIIQSDSVKKSQLDTLISFTRYPSRTRPGKVAEHLFANGFYFPFAPQRTTYDIMTSTGELTLIRDQDLRRQIVQLYTIWYGSLEIGDEILEEHMRIYMSPFVMNEVQFLGYNQLDESFLVESRFRNIVYTQLGHLGRRQGFHTRAYEEANRLKTAIEDYL